MEGLLVQMTFLALTCETNYSCIGGVYEAIFSLQFVISILLSIVCLWYVNVWLMLFDFSFFFSPNVNMNGIHTIKKH